jgi:hypothetical protein
MQYITSLVNHAQGAFWEGELLKALARDTSWEFWAHGLDRLLSFMPLLPMSKKGREAMAQQLQRLRERAAAAKQKQAAAAKAGQCSGPSFAEAVKAGL